MNPLFDLVAGANSQEAFIGVIMTTVLGMSFLTEGLGLSNTLGAFLSGMLLADTKHKHHIEMEAGPFRGILVGLFFFTVGFEIDIGMIMSSPLKIVGTVIGILILKTAIASLVCKGFGLPWSIAQRVGLVLSQGGEFAFVAFRTARSSRILSDEQTKFLLTCVSLTMALTPSLEDVGSQMAEKLQLKEAQTVMSNSIIQPEEVVIESITVPNNEQQEVILEDDITHQQAVETILQEEMKVEEQNEAPETTFDTNDEDETEDEAVVLSETSLTKESYDEVTEDEETENQDDVQQTIDIENSDEEETTEDTAL